MATTCAMRGQKDAWAEREQLNLGTVATNFLPANPGQSLGSQAQPWNLYATLVNGGTAVSQTVTATPYSSSMVFTSLVPISIQTTTLTGNVGSSTFSGVVGIVIFQITQDSTGGRTFSWPTNFKQPNAIGSAANAVTMQIFYFDGTNAWPLGPGVIYP